MKKKGNKISDLRNLYKKDSAMQCEFVLGTDDFFRDH